MAVKSALRLATITLIGATVFAAAAPAADGPAGNRPARGDRMASVEHQYGAPSTRYAAVGNPPITRWDYPSMVVYFENDRVIHAVLVSNPTN
jgi:hypothetical protein